MKEKTGLTKRVWRIVKRTPPIAACVVGCLSEYFFLGTLRRLTPARRVRVLQKWSRRALAAIDVRTAVHGEVPAHGLVVSNHLSYLDIMVFSAAAGCTFVAKREVKSWPGIGWIASLSGAIYIDRARRSETHTIQPRMQAALNDKLRLVVFPEGTSSDGTGVLKFHSSLLQPAVDLKTPVTAACLAYEITDGDAASEVCYWGDHILAPHLFNLLTKKSVQATIRFSEESLMFDDRKEATRRLRGEVERLRETTVR